jgi:hypothetical protein
VVWVNVLLRRRRRDPRDLQGRGRCRTGKRKGEMKIKFRANYESYSGNSCLTRRGSINITLNGGTSLGTRDS